MKRTIYTILLVLSTIGVLAQQSSKISIKAQATVVEKAEIELITMKDIEIDAGLAVNGKIYVSAKRDANAAVLMVKGKSDAYFSVSFTPVVEIANRAGTGSLILHYELYGYTSNNQSASEPINAAERTLQISKAGQYFFWLGGNIDISKARPGKYDGDFTIQMEYI